MLFKVCLPAVIKKTTGRAPLLDQLFAASPEISQRHIIPMPGLIPVEEVFTLSVAD